MNQRTRSAMPILLTLIAAITAGAFTSCARKQAPAAPPPPVVQVLEVTTADAPATAELIGQLDSPQNVEVRARVEAFVDEVLFTEGTEVKKGDRLFQLDDSPYLERLAAAEGRLAEAKASLNKYEKDVARLAPLAEKRAVPQQDLDNAIASVAVGEAAVLSAKAQVEAAMLDIGYCDVRAPIDGLIGAKQVSVGELVGKGSPTLLATISTLDPIWFYCNISEVEFLRAESETRRTGKRIADLPATLILADGSAHPEKGRFVFLDRAVDVRTGTLRARVEFPNPRKILRPGMFGRIRVDLGSRPDTILIPERAVAELQGKTFVWVVGADSTASQRPVQLGRQIDRRLPVLEGLEAGERIVVEGIQKVREGAPVRSVTAEELERAQKSAPTPGPAGEGAAKHGKE